MPTPAQIAERERIDPHVLDPANHRKGHAALAAEIGCTETFVRLRRTHYFPDRRWVAGPRRGTVIPTAAFDADDGKFDPEWAECLLAKPLPDAEIAFLADRVEPTPTLALNLADRCRAYFIRWEEVVQRHESLDWSPPAVETPRIVSIPHANRKVFTSGQIALLCRVSKDTVRKWCDDGRITSHRTAITDARRVRRADLIRFLQANNYSLGEVAQHATSPTPIPERQELAHAS